MSIILDVFGLMTQGRKTGPKAACLFGQRLHLLLVVDQFCYIPFDAGSWGLKVLLEVGVEEEELLG